VVSSQIEPSQSVVLSCQLLQETRDGLHFFPLQIPIPDDGQLCDLSEGETILIPFLCSPLNTVKSMTRQRHVLSTKMYLIQSTGATLPTFSAMRSTLSPLKVSIHDLSHRTSPASAPVSSSPVVLRLVQLRVPPHPLPMCCGPHLQTAASGFNPDIPF